MKPLILICSQDAEFYMILNHILAVEGFASALASDSDEMLKLAGETEAQAGILDCRACNAMAEVCSRLRQDARTSALPLIASIAPGAENQHIALLKSGVDESLVRPFAPAKLLDCLRSRLSYTRLPGSRPEGPVSLSHGDIHMQIDTHHVRCNGREILLGPIEFKLLRHMLENPGKVLTRDELIEAAWPGNVYVGPRTVDVHISRLRRSLRQSSDLDAIRTVRLGGYALEFRSGSGEQDVAHLR
ncbi:two-component system response regulator [Mesorhizobium hungaricum]|jgi:two-component system phosphate regulon response regulator PhoB|uniref:Two-component system response regulator n=2 Tax=Phyllobacteriaceae TaxID=69277 RepID=A0A1C2E3C0_9HYPH|nr:response regulator transcription factor [Mesorhizobium sp. YL-MeA3-2017]OCX21494.1 two-component system response regulator [Mesorhizobium hungaricum]